MKKLWLGLCLALFLGLSSATAHNNNVPKEVLKYAHDSIYEVRTEAGMGSGFWVDDNTFVTACHVVSQTLLSYERDEKTGEMIKTTETEIMQEVFVNESQGWLRVPVTVVSCDTAQDLAILKPEYSYTHRADVLPVYTGVVPVGTEVFGVGYPLGINLITTQGYWQGVYRYDNMRNIITAPTISGDSGSPVLAFVEGKWQIIAIRQAIVATKQTGMVMHIGLVTAGNLIQDHIQEYNF